MRCSTLQASRVNEVPVGSFGVDQLKTTGTRVPRMAKFHGFRRASKISLAGEWLGSYYLSWERQKGTAIENYLGLVLTGFAAPRTSGL
jgi:hypothetical protein